MLIFPRSTIWTVAALVAMLSAGRICSAAQAVKVFNPSFEQPVVVQAGIDLAPSAAEQGAGPGDSPWEFGQSVSAGIAARGLPITFAGSQTALIPPDGNQVLYLGADGDSAFQLLTFPSAGQYTLTFDEFGPVGVSIFSQNNVPVAILAQVVSLPQSDFYEVSGQFTIPSPGSYSLGFNNVSPTGGPQPLPPALVDSVSIAPEPACGMLLGLGLILIRRRKCHP